jgi:SAM-dependent methyltransferase
MAGPDAVNDVLLQHLRAQYAGVLDDAGIARHVEDYVGSALAAELIAMVLRHAPDARTLLDVGCGYGSFVLAARQRGIDAVGIELAPFEIDFARTRIARERPEDDAAAVYREGSALDLPFAGGAFDVVTLWNVLEHVPDGDRTLSEAIRVLRPGGLLYVVCPNYAAFRTEAHYHVFWPSLLPRRLASSYLRWRGRNPAFFEQHIYYRTNTGITRFLRRRGMTLYDLRIDRVTRPETINNPAARRAALALKRAGVLPLARLALQAALRNPLKGSVALYARKP